MSSNSKDEVWNFSVSLYSVFPIYRGRVYRGIGYIAVACWTPFFWRPGAWYFSRNCGNTLDPINGWQFFAKSAHRDSLCSRFAGDNFPRNQLWPTCQCGLDPGGWNTCCVMVSQALRSIDTSIVSQSRGRSIQCQCKSRLQIANLGIKNAFLTKSSLVDHTVYTRHLVQTLRQFRSTLIMLQSCRWLSRKTVWNTTTNPQNNSNVGIQRFYKHLSYTKTISLSSKFPEMYPDSWIYRGFTSCNFDLWWKQNGG